MSDGIEDDEGVYVQHHISISPPLSVHTLRKLLTDALATGTVDILDGELIEVRWDEFLPRGLS